MGFAARNRDTRNACQVRGHGVDIGEVHCQGIIYFLAQLESRRGTGRRDDRIHFFKSFVEIARQQCADFLRLQVVGIVIACAQRVGAEHDAPFYFRSESIVAAAPVHIRKRAGVAGAVAIAYAIKSRQVGGSFGSRNDVIRGDCVFGVRQRNRNNLASQAAQLFNRCFYRVADLAVETFSKILFCNADLQPTDRLF